MFSKSSAAELLYVGNGRTKLVSIAEKDQPAHSCSLSLVTIVCKITPWIRVKNAFYSNLPTQTLLPFRWYPVRQLHEKLPTLLMHSSLTTVHGFTEALHSSRSWSQSLPVYPVLQTHPVIGLQVEAPCPQLQLFAQLTPQVTSLQAVEYY